MIAILATLTVVIVAGLVVVLVVLAASGVTRDETVVPRPHPPARRSQARQEARHGR